MKHEHSIVVEKLEKVRCGGCGEERKVTRIATDRGRGGSSSICLCHKCLTWLKGKLIGF